MKLPTRFKPRQLTLNEYKEYKLFKENRTLKLSIKQIEYICDLFESVFNKTNINKTTKSLIGMIDKLDKVFESYEI